MTQPSRVYFIKPKGKAGPIKIGCSYTPESRLENFAAWAPWPLEVIGSVLGSFADEGFLHKCFAEYHQHREWFKAAPIISASIKKILAAGTVDAVRAELSPTGDIRKGRPGRQRTEEQKKRISYAARVDHCERRMRVKQPKNYRAPDDVHAILNVWRGYSYWDTNAKEFVRVTAASPTAEQLARIDEYLANPESMSVIPTWDRPSFKDPICIPVLGQEIEAAA